MTSEERARLNKLLEKFENVTGHGIVSGTWICSIYTMMEKGYSDEDIMEDIIKTESLHNDPEFKNQVADYLIEIARKYKEVINNATIYSSTSFC